MSNEKLIIPEKIDLLNKSKKLLNSIENINSILDPKKIKKSINNVEKRRKKETLKNKEKIKKGKSKKKIRTLWVRRKKKI